MDIEPSTGGERDASEGPAPDPVIEAYKAGLDRTLLRANLRRTVAERMAQLEAMQRFAQELRRAGRATDTP